MSSWFSLLFCSLFLIPIPLYGSQIIWRFFVCVCNKIDEVHLSEFREAGEDTLAL